jgi:hypothetical protein
VIFVSPGQFFDNKTALGTHFKLEHRLPSVQQFDYESLTISGSANVNYRFHYEKFDQTTAPVTEQTNVQITEVNKVNKRTSVTRPSGGLINNRSFTTDLVLYETPDKVPVITIDHLKGSIYGAVKRNIDVYCNLDSLTYVNIHPNALNLSSSQVVYGGDTFISPLSFYSVYGIEDETVLLASNTVTLNGVLLGNIYIESDINMALRVGENEACRQFFSPSENYLTPFPTGGFRFGEGLAYIQNLFTPLQDDGERAYTGVCENFFGINKDYHTKERIVSYRPLPSNYNCCSECLGEYPNRIMYSEQSFQEETTDNFRVFLPNNSRDIEAEFGPITDLLRYNDIL